MAQEILQKTQRNNNETKQRNKTQKKRKITERMKMRVIALRRREGKTTKLIEAADNYNGYLVVCHRAEVRRVMLEAQKLGKKINQPITFDDFVNKRYHLLGVKKFHIDNLDLLVRYISQVPIETISINTD